LKRKIRSGLPYNYEKAVRSGDRGDGPGVRRAFPRRMPVHSRADSRSGVPSVDVSRPRKTGSARLSRSHPGALWHRSGDGRRAAQAERFRRTGRARRLPVGQAIEAAAAQDRRGTGRRDGRDSGCLGAGSGRQRIHQHPLRPRRLWAGAARSRAAEPPRRPARSSSSTPTSIPTRRRTSGICATPSGRHLSCACCARAASASRCRTTSTTPACRWPMWWRAFITSNTRRPPRSGAYRKTPPCASTISAGTYTRALRHITRTPRIARVAQRDAARHRSRQRRELAELAHLVADAIVERHLATMLRLGVQYDVLPRESEILHLQFLGVGVRTAQAAPGHLPRNRGQERRLLGDARRLLPGDPKPTKTAR
jgi:hypothetical protein